MVIPWVPSQSLMRLLRGLLETRHSIPLLKLCVPTKVCIVGKHRSRNAVHLRSPVVALYLKTGRLMLLIAVQTCGVDVVFYRANTRERLKRAILLVT